MTARRVTTGEGSILVLTGAGLSAESGLGTFRDADGLWTKFDLAEVATPEGYARDPAKVLGFYDARRRNALAASPNAAHEALARLARARPGTVLVTQNVDNLHERAGAAAIHMHGSLTEALCTRCGGVSPWIADMPLDATCPACGEAGGVRPNVVWFGEMPYRMDEIAQALERAALFVAIGTSGTVYPAAGYVAEARALGVPTLELNLEPSETARVFDEARYGPATALVPAWVEEVLGG